MARQKGIRWDAPADETTLTNGEIPCLRDGDEGCAPLWRWVDAQVEAGMSWNEVARLLGCTGAPSLCAVVDRRRVAAGMEARRVPRMAEVDGKPRKARRTGAPEAEAGTAASPPAPLLNERGARRTAPAAPDVEDVPGAPAKTPRQAARKLDGQMLTTGEDATRRLEMAYGYLSATGQLAAFGQWVLAPGRP